MGTRGFITFVAGGVEKTVYNHCDSYPDGLGVDVLNWLRFAATDVPALRERVAALRVVDPNSKPTAEDVERLAEFARQDVGSRKLDDWYVLLRETQGKPGAMLQAGIIEDASDFPLDSLFAEYGYVVDLDAQVFEAYVGFQQGPHSKGRFAGRGSEQHGNSGLVSGGYYPVALAKSWPLAELPSDKDFLAALGEDES
ncbi:hypothetical protein GCM10023196_036130 [Actinoallomurus vinaceus]|uniref:Uncharacterized protein n=1 Tax=Actinoallomurus vinaceus TaxID=1080074 RepID=A0ABP8UAZ2_9ACTN